MGYPFSGQTELHLEDLDAALDPLYAALAYASLDGSPVDIAGPASPSSGGVRGEYLRYIDATTVAGYGIRRADYTKTGAITAAYDIADATLCRWNDMRSGAHGWAKWIVAMSPLAYGSGLTGAPSTTQLFGLPAVELNPENRHGPSPSFLPEARLFTNWVGGQQTVPETQDFTGTLAGQRIGYDCAWLWRTARSIQTNSDEQKHARTLAVWLMDPNAIAPWGYGMFHNGHKLYAKSVSLNAAGSGYVVGDLLSFSSGLSSSLNEEAVLRVLSVNGSGGVTGAEIWNAGGYSGTPTSPTSVTGGTGSGASFNFTLSGDAEDPRAAWGLAGRWQYGIDMACYNSALYARFSAGYAIRLNKHWGICARDSGDSADVHVISLDTSDFVKLASERVRNPEDWTPTFTAGSGTLGTATVSHARWSQINGWGKVSVRAQIAAGTGTTSIKLDMPFTPLVEFVGLGFDETASIPLILEGSTSGEVTARKADGGNPIVDGHIYRFDFAVEVA